ncbi:MAG: aspartate carbamoyltransferase [Candidatus Woesearchaeota archaeon]
MASENLYDKFKGRHVISIRDFNRQDLEFILRESSKMADRLKNDLPGVRELLKGRRMGLIFYEPSTRTVLSFATEMDLLGGTVEGIRDPKSSSAAKGEVLMDTIQVMSGYFFDTFVIRHYDDGSVRRASEFSVYPENNPEEGQLIPVLNGGDGSNQHPTQTMLDLYTVHHEFGTLDGLTYLLNNDLKNGRTVHSLIEALTMFNPKKVYCCSSSHLPMPEHIVAECKSKGMDVEEIRRYEDVLGEVDVLYDTRPQLEREPITEDLKEKIRSVYTVRAKPISELAKREMIIMHPLPRDRTVNSPEYAVDKLPQARYFQQSHNGIPVRAALTCLTQGVRI